MSIEGTANTEYASLSGKIRTFVVDKSLTISGACADAKATGERLKEIYDNIEDIVGEAANEAVGEEIKPVVAEEVSETVPKELLKFLDATLSQSDKAADAAAVGEALNGRAQVVGGSYVGTGGYGENSPNMLTFDFAPKAIIFFSSNGSIRPVGGGASVTPEQGMIFNPQLLGTEYNSGPPLYHPNTGQKTMSKRSGDGKTIWWYTTEGSASAQYNASGVTYDYVAIG